MPLSPGTRVGQYEIVAQLGAGGMGEVYRARDSKLGRDVAVKVMPAALAADADYLARFHREAQMLAALNHPNIAAIHGIEEGAIVMELVEGEDLRGPLPIETAIAYARQIAAGLEAAHEKGIIHRDLKPANIKVTADGIVKLLDFGLAKSVEAKAAASTGNTQSPTMSLAMTQAGMILGTAAYMSPEQARGKPVDKRADIWAFGVILFELLTGTMLFGGGETVSDSLAAVITREPDWNALPKDTPSNVRRLLERCLRKDPKLRMRDIGEARLTLDEPAAAPAGAAPARTSSRLPWAVAAMGLLAAGAGWWHLTRPAAPRALVRMNAEMSAGMPLVAGPTGGIFAISPDGSRIVATQRGTDKVLRLYTRLLDQNQLVAMPGTENASTPFFSPDGQWVGFEAQGKLKKVAISGGAPIVLCDAPNIRGASWGDDGHIVFTPNPGANLLRVPESGGAPTALTQLGHNDRTHRWPEVLPGSQAAIFTLSPSAVYDDGWIELVSLKTGQRKTLYRGGQAPHFVVGTQGPRILFVNRNRLFALAFDTSRMEVTGAPVPVLENVSTHIAAGGLYAVSRNGTLVFMEGTAQHGLWTLDWLDASGETELLHGPPSNYFTPRLSPDGKRLAYAAFGEHGFDLYVKDLDRNTASRLTFLPGTNNWPVWTPDGKAILFSSNYPEAPGVYWIRSDGGGEPHRLTDGKVAEAPFSFTPDGKTLALSSNGSGSDIFIAPVQGDSTHLELGKLEPFVATPAMEGVPMFSPDGRWIAYFSNESNVDEIYVRPFPGPGGKSQISNGGGLFPKWSRTGNELFFKGLDDRIMVAGYSIRGDTFVPGAVRVWSPTPIFSYSVLNMWDLTPDGKRIAAAIPQRDAGADTHLTFLLNFLDGLK